MDKRNTASHSPQHCKTPPNSLTESWLEKPHFPSFICKRALRSTISGLTKKHALLQYKHKPINLLVYYGFVCPIHDESGGSGQRRKLLLASVHKPTTHAQGGGTRKPGRTASIPCPNTSAGRRLSLALRAQAQGTLGRNDELPLASSPPKPALRDAGCDTSKRWAGSHGWEQRGEASPHSASEMSRRGRCGTTQGFFYYRFHEHHFSSRPYRIRLFGKEAWTSRHLFPGQVRIML